MGNIRYTLAPVSEVILGFTFKEPLINVGNYSSKLIKDLITDYPVFDTAPPVADDTLNFDLSPIASFDLMRTGQTLTRLWAADKSWLVQFQGNKIFVNWVRQDYKSVGKYPGFTSIFNRFKQLQEKVFTDKKVSEESISYYELVYNDRINISIQEFQNLKEIINFNYPKFKGLDKNEELISSSRYRVENLGGFVSLYLATIPNGIDKRILTLQVATKGFKNETIDEWFRKAHQIQNDIFEELVTRKKLEEWT